MHAEVSWRLQVGVHTQKGCAVCHAQREPPGQKVTLLTGVKPWGSCGECSTTRCAPPAGGNLQIVAHVLMQDTVERNA